MSENKNDGFYHGYDEEDNSSGNDPGNYYSDLPDYGGSRNNTSPQMNASAAMDEMLNEYRKAHGMKQKSSYQIPQQPSYYDEQSKNYAYQRDARNQMDDMIDAYKSEQRKNNAVADEVLRGLTEPVRTRRRRWEEREYDMTLDSSFSSSARYSTMGVTRPKGKKRIVFGLIIAGILLVVLSLTNGVRGVLNAQASERMISGYTTVEGVVKFVNKDSGRRRVTKYDVSYAYSYKDKDYVGRDSLYSESAARLDLKSKNAVGRTITVYIDPDDPSKSMLDSDPYPAFWIWIMPVLGMGMVITGLVMMKKSLRV